MANLEEGKEIKDQVKLNASYHNKKVFLSHGEYPFFAVPGIHYEPTIWRSAKIFGGAVVFWTIHTVFLENGKK